MFARRLGQVKFPKIGFIGFMLDWINQALLTYACQMYWIWYIAIKSFGQFAFDCLEALTMVMPYVDQFESIFSMVFLKFGQILGTFVLLD